MSHTVHHANSSNGSGNKLSINILATSSRAPKGSSYFGRMNCSIRPSRHAPNAVLPTDGGNLSPRGASAACARALRAASVHLRWYRLARGQSGGVDITRRCVESRDRAYATVAVFMSDQRCYVCPGATQPSLCVPRATPTILQSRPMPLAARCVSRAGKWLKRRAGGRKMLAGFPGCAHFRGGRMGAPMEGYSTWKAFWAGAATAYNEAANASAVRRGMHGAYKPELLGGRRRPPKSGIPMRPQSGGRTWAKAALVAPARANGEIR